jgi:hypothetical protein
MKTGLIFGKKSLLISESYGTVNLLMTGQLSLKVEALRPFEMSGTTCSKHRVKSHV